MSLGLKATPRSLLAAEDRAIALAAPISTGAYPAGGLPWERAAEATAAGPTGGGDLCVGEWVERLEAEFWLGRVRSSAAERTWDRITTELKRLPKGATLTTDLLVAVAAATQAGSRSRLEACKVYKRLGKVAGLEGLEQLDALRTPYEPAERELPPDEALVGLVEAARGHEKRGWATAALVAHGCRPADVFSLQPTADGTARVLSIKRKGKLPAWRTAMALPPEWVERFELERVRRPWDCPTPTAYDSVVAKGLTQKWGKWVGARWRGCSSMTCGTPGPCGRSGRVSMRRWRRSAWGTRWRCITTPATGGWISRMWLQWSPLCDEPPGQAAEIAHAY